MQIFVPTVFAALVAAVSASCEEVSGNYYCSLTTKVTYEGIGFSGSYNDVTNMDESTGECTSSSLSFSGNLSPLDEELSVHFRGPIKLLQFGVYYPSSSSSSSKKKRAEEDCEVHAHHKHKRATAIEVETQTVYVDGNGQLQTSTAAATPAAVEVSASASVGISVGTDVASTSTSSSANSASSSTSSASAGDWVRASYYTPGSADNCTFLNYYGGSGSGTWSSTFGNSLSYANSDASGGSSSAVALEECTVASDVEFIIFSGSECDGDCGYYRADTPAYHGFGGKEKILVFEFEMPTATDSATNNYDMPAVWLLNAKIPRTLQYGDASCSCWSTGCGELDLFEILSSGSSKLISHLHDGQGDAGTTYGGGGSSDYFARPTSGSLKAAVVFDGENISIVEVDDDFSSVLSSDTVQGWVDQSGSVATLV
ncbi:protein Tos1p [[Candida] railenensis]|uniref:glucan endo-1,3-beta-D-glucosidase n=1 Tax=[Candida] railenensis TaxID=45579 RepID=A0A9P0QT24_9ASCO|nr:protein Tos1p [[Candida] railenensis]